MGVSDDWGGLNGENEYFTANEPERPRLVRGFGGVFGRLDAFRRAH